MGCISSECSNVVTICDFMNDPTNIEIKMAYQPLMKNVMRLLALPGSLQGRYDNRTIGYVCPIIKYINDQLLKEGLDPTCSCETSAARCIDNESRLSVLNYMYQEIVSYCIEGYYEVIMDKFMLVDIDNNTVREFMTLWIEMMTWLIYKVNQNEDCGCTI